MRLSAGASAAREGGRGRRRERERERETGSELVLTYSRFRSHRVDQLRRSVRVQSRYRTVSRVALSSLEL